MLVDVATAGDRDVRPGDIVTGTITGRGEPSQSTRKHRPQSGDIASNLRVMRILSGPRQLV